MSPIKLLTFDLDDTLWDLRPVLLRAEQVTYAWLQTHAPALTQQFTLEQLRDLRIALAQREPSLGHRVTAVRLRAQQHALMLAGYGENEAAALSQQAFEVFAHARHDVSFFDGALDVLAELHRHYMIAAITNGNASPTRLGLDHLFAFTITAEHFERPKPYADPFEAALARANCSPTQAIHIGDHVEHDVLGAMQMGMHTIWVNRDDASWPEAQIPSATIRHLTELPGAVRDIAERNCGAR